MWEVFGYWPIIVIMFFFSIVLLFWLLPFGIFPSGWNRVLLNVLLLLCSNYLCWHFGCSDLLFYSSLDLSVPNYSQIIFSVLLNPFFCPFFTCLYAFFPPKLFSRLLNVYELAYYWLFALLYYFLVFLGPGLVFF